MSQIEAAYIRKALMLVAGAGLVATIAVVQAAVFSRLVGAYETKWAETQSRTIPETSLRMDERVSQQIEERAERALKADSTNGWACWLLSKEYLRRARIAQNSIESEKHLNQALQLAQRGTRSFNSVACFKQLASIYLALDRLALAAPYLEIVTCTKPGDIEVFERLGMILLTQLEKAKWNDSKKIKELSDLCESILQKHPYSANAYYYKALIAQQAKMPDKLDLYARQAYVMMQQKTGQIFFDTKQLEKLVTARRLWLKPPAKTSGTTSP